MSAIVSHLTKPSRALRLLSFHMNVRRAECASLWGTRHPSDQTVVEADVCLCASPCSPPNNCVELRAVPAAVQAGGFVSLLSLSSYACFPSTHFILRHCFSPFSSLSSLHLCLVSHLKIPLHGFVSSSLLCLLSSPRPPA